MHALWSHRYLIDIGAVPSEPFQQLVDDYTATIALRDRDKMQLPENERSTSSLFMPPTGYVLNTGRGLGRFLYRPPDPPLSELPHDLLYPLNPEVDWAKVEAEVRHASVEAHVLWWSHHTLTNVPPSCSCLRCCST